MKAFDFVKFALVVSISIQSCFVAYGQTEDRLPYMAGGCLRYEKVNRIDFSHDSVLYQFYRSVNDSMRVVPKGVDTADFLIKLLGAARNNSSDGCLLPFLRLFDNDADSLYSITPYSLNRTYKYGVYQSDLKIQYLVLFAIHHKLISNFKLPKGYYFDQIDLKKRHSEQSDYWFNQHDYDILYDIYTLYFKNSPFKKRHKHKNPLAHSDYEWVIEIKRH